MGKPEIKRSLGRPRHMLEDNIKMDVIGIRLGVMNWIFLGQDMEQRRALVDTKLRPVHSKLVSRKCIGTTLILSV
jgi:hypothetical protein